MTSRHSGVSDNNQHAERGDYDGEEDCKESDEEGREEALTSFSREREGAAVAPFVFSGRTIRVHILEAGTRRSPKRRVLATCPP